MALLRWPLCGDAFHGADAVSTNTCPRAGRWFGGCRWEARYDHHPPDADLTMALPSLQRSVFLDNDIEALELLRSKTYIRDVCTRCGRTIERNEK